MFVALFINVKSSAESQGTMSLSTTSIGIFHFCLGSVRANIRNGCNQVDFLHVQAIHDRGNLSAARLQIMLWWDSFNIAGVAYMYGMLAQFTITSAHTICV